jgi:hypothetical protein
MNKHKEAAMEHDDKPQASKHNGSAAPDPARRQFLKAAPLGALAVVAAPLGAAEAPPAATAAPAPVARGYHETEHIRRYYQTAAYW